MSEPCQHRVKRDWCPICELPQEGPTMSEPIKLPPMPDTEYTLAVPAAPYEPAWISSMEAWDESAMENYATLAVEQATAELRAEREALRVLLARYRNEVPVGHQPHMIAHEVDAALKEVK